MVPETRQTDGGERIAGRNVTPRDVARRAGVHVSTASRALDEGREARVGPEKIERVRNAAAELDCSRDLRCPDDVSVVGYNDIPMSHYISPSLPRGSSAVRPGRWREEPIVKHSYTSIPSRWGERLRRGAKAP